MHTHERRENTVPIDARLRHESGSLIRWCEPYADLQTWPLLPETEASASLRARPREAGSCARDSERGSVFGVPGGHDEDTPPTQAASRALFSAVHGVKRAA